MKEKKYTSAIKLTEDTWKYSPKSKKIELLNTLGYDESWAETKTIPEMVRRGGGMVSNGLLKLSREYLKRNGGKVTINWN